MIAAALSSNVPLAEPPVQPSVDNRRRRYGSGRFVESNFSYNQQYSDYFQPNGTKKTNDYRHSYNESSNKGYRDHLLLTRENDRTRSEGGEEEPEWLSCGPTSKHDVIELHGFDGASQESLSLSETKKKDCDGKSVQSHTTSPSNTNASPPARSTPAKFRKPSEDPVRGDEYFNFEDFLKLDFPNGHHHAKETELGGGSGNGNGNGESRFQRWFRRESPPQKNTRMQNPCTSEHFFEMMQKNQNRKMPPASNLMATSSKFRSVEELEAKIVAPAGGLPKKQQQQQQKQMNDLETFRKLLGQMSSQNDHNRGNPINIFDLINRNSQEILQYQIAQQMVLKRPEAQILLQRLGNNEINQLHLLHLLLNPNTSQYDRDTLTAVVNVCNENQRIMQQNQLRAYQMRQGLSGSPTNQELRFHTQAIMQGALMKKQFEDQCRKAQAHKTNSFGPSGNGYNSYNRMPHKVSTSAPS